MQKILLASVAVAALMSPTVAAANADLLAMPQDGRRNESRDWRRSEPEKRDAQPERRSGDRDYRVERREERSEPRRPPRRDGDREYRREPGED